MRTVGGHSFAAGKRMVGGHWPGVLGSEIISGGQSGPSPYYNDGILPDKYYRSLNVTTPSGYTIWWFDDGSADIETSANGTYAHTYRLFENNVDEGTAVINFSSGVITADMAATEGSDSASFAASFAVASITGVLAVSEASDIAVFSATFTPFAVSGTFVSTEGSDTAAFAASFLDNTILFDLSASESQDSASFNATFLNGPITGTFAATEGSDSCLFVATGVHSCTRFSHNLGRMATRIIGREGQIVTLYQVEKNTTKYVPGTGLVSPTTEVTSQVKAIFLDFALLSNGLMARGGSVIEANDKQVYLSTQTIQGTPLPMKLSPAGDYIIDGDGKKWRIMLVKESNLSGSCPIHYDLLVRAMS